MTVVKPIVLTSLALCLLGYLMTPTAITWVIADWFDQHGTKIQIESISISPLSGGVELTGFKGEMADGEVFHLNSLSLDISLTALRDKKLIVEDFKLDGLSVNIRKTPSRFIVAGVDINALTAASEPQVSEPTQDDKPLLNILLQQASFNNVDVCVKGVDSDTVNSGGLNANLCLLFADLSFSKAININLESDPVISIPEEIWLKKFEIKDYLKNADEGNTSFAFTELKFKATKLDSQKISMDEVRLTSLKLLEQNKDGIFQERQPYHFGLEQFLIQDMLVELNDGPRLSIKDIQLLGLDAFVHVNDDRTLAAMARVDGLMSQISSLSAQSSTEEKMVVKVAENKTTTQIINIENINLNKDSRIFIVDQGVHPTVEQEINNISIQLGPIDSQQSASLTNVLASLKINDYGSLTVKGDVQVFSKELNMNLAVGVASFDMLPMSPYIERAMQYKIHSGLVGSTISVKVLNNEIDSVANVRLDKFHIKSLKKAELAKNEEEGTLPMGLALDLLRDGDDKIEIRLPITGRVDDPDFSVKNIMGIVFRKAVMTGVINYYTPYGLVALASSAVDVLTEIRFKPLVYTGGDTKLTEDHIKQMDKIVKILINKPHLALSFCPIVTQIDAMALLEVDAVPRAGLSMTPQQRVLLVHYGTERVRQVKKYLIGQKITHDQVILCQPELDLTTAEPPEVMIHF